MAIRRYPNVELGPLGNRMAAFLERYPRADELRITSGMDGDHGGQSHHYGLSYQGSPTAALDIGAERDPVKMRDFAKWMYDQYSTYTVELIHSTPFADDDGFYVKNQRQFPGGGPYGSPSQIGHFDHIHWATSRELMSELERRAGGSGPARVHPGALVPGGAIANTAPVWGWDASDHDYGRGPMNLVDAQRDGISFFIYKATEGSDWKSRHYQEILERARNAGIPVLGTYHFLWPDDIESQIDFWMRCVEEQTPWWKDVPWIWQVDAEQSDNAPRPPNPAEVEEAVNLLKGRLAEQGNAGYVIGYTPFWLYGNSLSGDYDIWASNYSGSGLARPFKEQYQGVGDHQVGWNPMSGRKPRILQFASDGVVGTQPTCCVDKFDGDLHALIRLCGRELQPVTERTSHGVEGYGRETISVDFATSDIAVDEDAVPARFEPSKQFQYNGDSTPRQPVAEPSEQAADRPLAASEQRELLERLRGLQAEVYSKSGQPGDTSEQSKALCAPNVTGARRGDNSLHPKFAGAPRDVTGPGITSAVAMEAADLGILRWDSDRNALAVMFGDNFEFRGMHGEWQSPSIVMYDRNYNVLGIPATNNRISMGRRRQLWNYQHNNPEYSTILPCDFIKVNGVWYVAAMVTQGLGNEKWTVFWQSRDLVNWEKTSPYVNLAHRDGTGRFIGHPGNVMLTFDRIGDYVYIFGTNGLQRDRGVWMWRNAANQFPHGWWEPWGWDGHRWGWGIANENTPILEGRHGELSFRYLQGNCVLSYFNEGAYRQTVRTVPFPEADWRNGAEVVDYAFGSQIPQLYGGYISPLSRLNEPNGMHFFVSQWLGIGSTNDPYRVMLLQDTLRARGPLGPVTESVSAALVPEATPAPSDNGPAPSTRQPVCRQGSDERDAMSY